MEITFLLGAICGLCNKKFSFRLSFQVPDNGVNHLSDRLLLFRHDYNSNNILQMISSPSEIMDETLVEIVLTANRKRTFAGRKTVFLIFPFSFVS
jgi:hypothetical protein